MREELPGHPVSIMFSFHHGLHGEPAATTTQQIVAEPPTLLKGPSINYGAVGPGKKATQTHARIQRKAAHTEKGGGPTQNALSLHFLIKRFSLFVESNVFFASAVDNLSYVSFCHFEVFHECEREKGESYPSLAHGWLFTRGKDVMT